jgi:hypothetical protein
MRFSVVVKQPNFSSFWTLGLKCHIQIFELCAVKLGTYCGVRRKKFVVDNTLKIPPN